MNFKNRLKRCALVLTAAFMITGVCSGGSVTSAYADENSVVTANMIKPNIVIDGGFKAVHAGAGTVAEVKIPVRAEDYPAMKPTVDVDTGSELMQLASEPVVVNSTGNRIKYISTSEHCYIAFSVKISEKAAAGVYNKFTITVGFRDSANKYHKQVLEVSNLKIVVDKSKSTPDFDISNITLPSSVKPGDTFKVKFTLSNRGETAAKDTKVSMTGYDANFIAAGTAKKNIGTLSAGETKPLSFEFTVSENVVTSAVVPLTVTVKSASGAEGGTEESFSIQVSVVAPSAADNPLVEITSISIPRDVTVGENVYVAVTFTNTSDHDADNFACEITGFDASGLQPVSDYTKKRVEKLKAGKSYSVNYTFKATDGLSEGIHSMAMNWSYFADTDRTQATKIADTQNIYFTGIDDSANKYTNSVPKLMISKYSTGKKKIMAGKIFNFTFIVENTNKTIEASNIQATVSSDDNTFAITEGSASFMLDSLAPGEKKKLTVPLKVKGDVATNGYDLKITFDYEYQTIDPAISKNPISKAANSATVLKLQVYSNDRPQVSNISVGSGETPVFGEQTDLSFDFNNMGKSPLYNVTAKVSGDFESTGDMLIIGNVEAGTGKNWSITVTPMVQSYGNGTLTISYEDSNGNVSSYDTPFESEITEPQQEMPPSDLDNGQMTEQKKELPIWAFIIMEILVFLAATGITRLVYLKRYKKKMREKLDEEDEDI